MVANIQHQNIAETLDELLDGLQHVADEMSHIVQEERQAARVFAGEELERLFDARARCQSNLVELESRCRRIMMRLGMAKDMPLEQFIAEHIDVDMRDVLQAKRLSVLSCLEAVREATEENKILLHAAWSVASHVLHELGAVPERESYGAEAVAYGGVR